MPSSSPIVTRAETPDTVHGRLLEAVHVTGYTFERACGELEWLIDKDRWRTVGGGFKDFNKFLATIDLSKFRSALESRSKLAKRLADLGASQRASARLIGVDKETIREDLGIRKRGGNPPPATADAPIDTSEVSSTGGNPPAWFQSDTDPSREAKRVTNRDAQQAERAATRSARAAAAQAAIVNVDEAVQHADFRTTAQQLADDSVSLVFTDPPYDDGFLPAYRDLGLVAARVLQDGGSLITYTGHHRIPEVIAMLQAAGLTFFWPLAVVYTSGTLARMTEYGIIVHWKPLLWFVKGAFRSREDMRFVHDVIPSPQAEKTDHPWQQEIASARYYIEMLTHPGDLVFDPFCGGGTTAVAAKLTQRRYLTCDIDEQSVWIARQRLSETP